MPYFPSRLFCTVVTFMIVAAGVSCGEQEMMSEETASDTYLDTTTFGNAMPSAPGFSGDTTDSTKMSTPIDSTFLEPSGSTDELIFHDDSIAVHTPGDSSFESVPEVTPSPEPHVKIAKGFAMVYCPSKMIDGLPSIVNATVTKDEIIDALFEFKHQRKEENPDVSATEIEKNTRSEMIDLYEKMAVKIDLDPDVFQVSPQETFITKSFENKKQLDWEWDITPLHTTAKSYVHFRFYYADTITGSMQEILDKRISVDVTVDNRAFLDRWKTFLLGDPKTTTTAILIPLATFLGGFLTSKKNKKSA